MPTISYCFRKWAHVASSCALSCSSPEVFTKFSGRKLACTWQALTIIDWFPRPPPRFPNCTPKLLSSCWWGISRTSYPICTQKMWNLNVQYRRLILNVQYASKLQKWGKQEHLLGVGKGGGSASAAIKTSSRKISYLVVFIRTVSHSGTQQKCCTFACTCASTENKICSPQSIYLPISLTQPTAHPADWNSENSMTRQKANTVRLRKVK